MSGRELAMHGERVRDIVPTAKCTQRESLASPEIGKDLFGALRAPLPILSR